MSASRRAPHGLPRARLAPPTRFDARTHCHPWQAAGERFGDAHRVAALEHTGQPWGDRIEVTIGNLNWGQISLLVISEADAPARRTICLQGDGSPARSCSGVGGHRFNQVLALRHRGPKRLGKHRFATIDSSITQEALGYGGDE
jgi:hypothetical protein